MGTISFDLDGCLANFIRGILRIGHELYGTPVGGHVVQKQWNFDEWPELGLTKDQFRAMFKECMKRPRFWQDLDPYNPSIMPRIGKLVNRVFITNRASEHDAARQSRIFLANWGIACPHVIVASDKVPAAKELQVIAHVDDLYDNCVALKDAIPDAYVALLWTDYNECYHDEWKARGGEVVLSVDHFMDECDKRGLSRYIAA